MSSEGPARTQRFAIPEAGPVRRRAQQFYLRSDHHDFHGTVVL